MSNTSAKKWFTFTSTYPGKTVVAATLHPINKDFIKALDCSLFDIKTVLLLHASMIFLCRQHRGRKEEKRFKQSF